MTNQLIPSDAVKIVDGKPVTTSLKISEAFGKRHCDVIRSVEKLLENEEVATRRNFALSEYTDSTGRKLKAYNADFDGLMLAVMGFTGKPALFVKLAFIDKFNYYRNAVQKKNSHPHLPANSLLGGIIEYKKVRVIPNVALSALFRCSGSTLRNHRTKHSHLLQEGRDYFTLTKRKEVADLQAAYPENPWVPYAGTKVTLWTETGAKTLAALLRNNHAVYTCSLLSKNYFNAVPVKAPKPKPVHFINEHIDTMLKQCTSSKSGVSYTGYLLEEWKRADTILQKYAMIEACRSARDICGFIISTR